MHLLLYVFQLETIFDVCMSFIKIVLGCLILKWKCKRGGGVIFEIVEFEPFICFRESTNPLEKQFTLDFMEELLESQ